MWLKNKRRSTNAQMWHSWKCVYLMSLVSLHIISNASGNLVLPKKEWIDLVAKDNNVLLNADFLPFLHECTKPNHNLTTKSLCTLYYDMVYNVYQYNPKVSEVQQEIKKANVSLENSGDQFCDFLANETKVLDKPMFSDANNMSKWLSSKIFCTLNCVYIPTTGELQAKVQPVCRFIVGGCKWISMQKSKAPLTIGTEDVAGKTVEKSNMQQPLPLIMQALSAAVDNEEKNPVPDPNTKQSLVAPPLKSADGPSLSKSTKSNPSTPTNASSKNMDNPSAGQIQPKVVANSTPTLKNSANPPADSINKPSVNNNSPPETDHIEKNIQIVPNDNNPSMSYPDNENNDAAKDDALKGDIIEAPNVPIKDDQIKDDTNKDEPDKDDPYKTEDEGAKQAEENDDDNTGDDPEEDMLGGNDKNDKIENNENNENSEDSARRDDKIITNNAAPLRELVDFREDKDSGFFPYFMFLMFVIVSFYVAYHNKSKILALLIEGRRSRSYSSRGGSRRKQHSAEYRKLDSNLEEAIQSEGGHVMSTQIIY